MNDDRNRNGDKGVKEIGVYKFHQRSKLQIRTQLNTKIDDEFETIVAQ